jgi:hypothetical protein
MMKKNNINVYYKRPVDLQKEAEEKQLLELERKEMIANMSDSERDIYYREQELALQNKMLQAQALAIQQQNEQLKMQQKQFDSMAKCPRCGSTSLSGQKKGYGVVKGGLGALALGAMTGGVGAIVGLGAGNIGRKKVIITCMNCGKRFKA